ncbi:MAG: RelA/SpoT family protein [Pseudomonadota bacterium]
MGTLTELVNKVKTNHPESKFYLIENAYRYASRSEPNATQSFNSITLEHRVGAANIIADMRLDAACVCSALLHDVIEDHIVSVTELEQEFGETIAFLVEAISRLDQYHFTSHEEREAESFRKMILATAKDIRVVLIKIAERLATMRMLKTLSADIQKAITLETMDIYAPLAERLGLQWLKGEFEDLSFRYLEPQAFNELDLLVNALADDTERYLKDMIETINKSLTEYELETEVTGRCKRLSSLHQEMIRCGLTFNQVQDFVAFRIITEKVADCYTVLEIIHSQWTPVPGRFKDFIKKPKSNKYQSLHTTVVGPGELEVELQIRTREMHKIAEYGIAAHWLYKEHISDLDPKLVASFAWLRQLADLQKEVGDLEEFNKHHQLDPFPDDVYVLTPSGNVMNFPRGATPLDFAYAIQTDLGHRFTSARVNATQVPIDYELQNGDVVEIYSENSNQANARWLEIVVTKTARSEINAYLCSKQDSVQQEPTK